MQEVPPSRSLPRTMEYTRDSGGEAASLREAPLPRPPLPKSGWDSSWSVLLTWFPLPVGYAPFQLVASTAADRAAADMRVHFLYIIQQLQCLSQALEPSLFSLRRSPRRIGRGGSVSRRGYNPLAGNRTQLSGGTNSKEATNPNASRSSGEGVWGGGASLREAASSPASPSVLLFESGSGGERFSLEKCSPPESPLTKLSSLRFFCAFCAFFRLG